MEGRIGQVAGLWRYPVKSMQGEELPASEAGERGLAGDRGWALIDEETGKVVSAKRPKLWLGVLESSARYVEEPRVDGPPATVLIALPDGREVRSDDPERDRILSEAYGRRVRLAESAPEGATYELRALDAEGLETQDPERLTETQVGMFSPPGAFFDTSTLHILTTATLRRFAEAHPEGEWDPRRFRPNVLVDLDSQPSEGFAENEWVGHSLGIGGGAEAAVLAPMPRCVMTTLPQPDLPRDPKILRTIAERNRREIEGYGSFACIGALANVSAPGHTSVGDDVTLGAPL